MLAQATLQEVIVEWWTGNTERTSVPTVVGGLEARTPIRSVELLSAMIAQVWPGPANCVRVSVAEGHDDEPELRVELQDATDLSTFRRRFPGNAVNDVKERNSTRRRKYAAGFQEELERLLMLAVGDPAAKTFEELQDAIKGLKIRRAILQEKIESAVVAGVDHAQTDMQLVVTTNRIQVLRSAVAVHLEAMRAAKRL